jgi:hypothetical protein
MHTAKRLNESMFSMQIENVPSTAAGLFPDWGPLDRFGLVVHEPFGSIGASYLLQLAIVSFYDVRPQRRSETERIYPNVVIFHVGEDHGEHVMFDFFPQRKEVFVDNTPARILEAINDRGIRRRER